MNEPTPQTKKEPYTGDPNATLTMCSKKLRRHTGRDLVYTPVKVEPVEASIPATVEDESAEATVQKPTMTIMVTCKYCKHDPVIYTEEADVQGDDQTS